MILFLSQTNIETIFFIRNYWFQKNNISSTEIGNVLKLSACNVFYKAYHSGFLLFIYVDIF